MSTKSKKNKKFLVYVAGNCPQSYVTWLIDALEEKDVKIVEFKTNKDLANAKEYPNLILFTGGSDVNPEMYGETKGKYTHVNKERDNFERDFWKLFKSGGYGIIPKIGICRGAQFITVQSGGKLIQHVEGHNQSHNIITTRGERYAMTSDHHQMMFPFNVSNHTIIAWSEYFKSSTYLDGNNEEIDLPREFVEPEIVFYNSQNALCIQGHPEYSSCPTKTSDYCKELVRKLVDKKLPKYLRG